MIRYNRNTTLSFKDRYPIADGRLANKSLNSYNFLIISNYLMNKF